MKRRTIIVDLDCPFGINHFDLMPCDECLDVGIREQGVINPLTNVPFAPAQVQNIEWTTIAAGSTTDLSWTNVSGGPTTSPVFKIDNNTHTDTDTFEISNIAKISIS